jgi:glucose-6-phosphate 1-dehydrogenase
MEPPASFDADAIRDEKLKVLRSLKPFTRESVARDVGARPVPRRQHRRPRGAGLPEEAKVPAGSPHRDLRRAEAEVDNWRWAGVPFYLRTGKRLWRLASPITSPRR